MKTMSKEYSTLFNEITDVSKELTKLVKRLLAAQLTTEEMFITDDESDSSKQFLD